MAELVFNGANQEAMDDFSVVPASTYNAQVVKSDVVPTKKKDGTRMNLQFKIIDGEFKGRIIFAGYNIDNPNPDAVAISRKEVKSLCDAIGKPDGITDTNQLHNIPLQIKLKIVPAKDGYPEKNEISFYEPYEGPAAGGSSAAVTSTPAGTEGGKPDWAK